MSLRCLPEESLGPKLPIKRIVKTDQTGQMPRLIRVFFFGAKVILVAAGPCSMIGYVSD